MSEPERTALQIELSDAIARAEHSRDYYDGLLRKKLATSGKPLWDIERGKTRRPGPKTLRAIEQVLGYELDYLVDLVHPREDDKTVGTSQRPAIISDDTVEIVSLDLSLSMGPGTLIEDFVESEPVKMDLGLVQSITRTPSDRLRLVKGVGDSMEPTLRPHDRIMVDINDRQLTRINGIYWIDYFGSHGIKRLRPAGKGRVMIISDNPAVESYEVGADEIRIEGRVIWFAREL